MNREFSSGCGLAVWVLSVTVARSTGCRLNGRDDASLHWWHDRQAAARTWSHDGS